jgi:hypothetical protein
MNLEIMTGAKGKNPLLSKTMVVNAAALIVGLLSLAWGQVEWVAYEALIVAVLNLILRTVTSEPLDFTELFKAIGLLAKKE